MKTLIAYSSTDRKGKKDASGAFIPEAFAFKKLHEFQYVQLTPIPQDIPKEKRFKIIMDALFNPIDTFVYFGHGTPNGLPGLGINRSNVDVFAKKLDSLIEPHGRIILFACLAGKGFGIGDLLDTKVKENVKTYSHLTAGHTDWNPFVEYSGEGPTRSGIPIITASDPLWPLWIKRLKEDQKFRLTFPFLSYGEIETWLKNDHIPSGPSKLKDMV